MQTVIAGLQVKIFQFTPQAPRAAVILCHGFGAPGTDLVDLAPELARQNPALNDVRFYFPAAPLSLGEMGFGDSRAWWMIDMEKVQRFGRDEAALREFCSLEPEGMAAARKTMLALVQDVATHTHLPMNRIFLGGFSQGAMLATDVALRLEESPGGLCVLSGALVNSTQWTNKAKARSSLPVFQSHGRQDPVLPLQGAQWLKELFTEAGMPHEFVPFDGGHTIGREALVKLGAFLEKHSS